MSHTKRVIGFLVLVSLVVGLMGVIAHLPRNQDLTGRVIYPQVVFQKSENALALSKAIGREDLILPESKTVEDVIREDSFAQGDEELIHQYLLTLRGAGIEPDTRVGVLISIGNEELLDYFISVSNVVLQAKVNSHSIYEDVLQEQALRRESLSFDSKALAYQLTGEEIRKNAEVYHHVLEDQNNKQEMLLQLQQKELAKIRALERHQKAVMDQESDYTIDLTYAHVISTQTDRTVSMDTFVGEIISQPLEGINAESKLSSLSEHQRQGLLKAIITTHKQDSSNQHEQETSEEILEEDTQENPLPNNLHEMSVRERLVYAWSIIVG